MERRNETNLRTSTEPQQIKRGKKFIIQLKMFIFSLENEV